MTVEGTGARWHQATLTQVRVLSFDRPLALNLIKLVDWEELTEILMLLAGVARIPLSATETRTFAATPKNVLAIKVVPSHNFSV